MTVSSSITYTALQFAQLGAVVGLAAVPSLIKIWGKKMGSMKDALGDTPFKYDEPLPSLVIAEKARDVGLKDVKESNNEWFSDAMMVIASLPVTFEGIGEDVRFAVTEAVGPPNKSQAWGSLIAHAIKRGHLVETGELRKMKDVQSHARRSMVLRKANPL